MSRSSARRSVAAALLGGGLLVRATQAHGEEPPRLRLGYTAPAECPSRDDLLDQLRARVPAAWLAGDDPRRFDVEITRNEGGGVTGRLVVRGPDAEPDVRAISAPTCAAVSTAIAVFLALALDPKDESTVRAPVPAVAEPARPAGKTRRATPTTPAPTPTTPSWQWSSGLQATYLRAGEPAWGARVHAEIARAMRPASIAPAARLSYGWADFSIVPPLAGEARFRLRTARLEGCARAPIAQFMMTGCAALDIGTLTGTTPDLPRVGRAVTRWTAAGAIVHASWPLGRWLAVELDAGVLVPFERTAFALVDPFRFVYRPPALVFEGGAGACVSGRFH